MIQFIVEKLLSKKFIGWLGACVFLVIGKIDAQVWMWITLGYMGIEGALNILQKVSCKE